MRIRGQIRSHRALKRKIIAPWIVATVATIVTITVVSTGFYFVVRKPCSGQLTATIAAAPSNATVIEKVAREWLEGQPVVNGHCASVDVEPQDSASMVDALGQPWNAKSGGAPPDAWIPDSSVWVRRAALNPAIAKMFPDSQPSLARSVSVIAMPRPMAQALGWPKAQLTWSTLINEVAPAGWAHYGKPEWGPVRIGMSDPTKSTAGLLALVSIAGADAGGRPIGPGLATINRLKQTRAVLSPTTDNMIADLAKGDRQGVAAVVSYLSAFPALETDVLAYNQPNPNVPLVAIYPSDGSVDCDNPYLILRAPWADPTRQKVAQAFLSYARGANGRRAYLEAGFRTSNRSPGKGITADNGLTAKLTTPERPTPAVETVSQILTVWTGSTS